MNFPTPYGTAFRAAASLLARRKRRFRDDARRETDALQPPLVVTGQGNIPAAGPCLVTVNHYGRPGFWAWWLAFAVASVIRAEMHWVMTREIAYRGQRRSQALRLLTRLGIRGLGQVYGFTIMPPMPPDPAEVTERSLALRHLFAAIRSTPALFVGYSPEGTTMPGGALGWPPPGSGKMMLHMARCGLKFLPAGAYEANGAFHLGFGSPYSLELPPDMPRDAADREASRIVMGRIGRLLPQHMISDFRF
jgi:hypothetical protein